MGKELVKILNAFRYSNEKALWDERPEGAPDVYHTTGNGVPGWQEVYSFFMCCIQLGLMSREELEKKIVLALKNKRLAREFLGHVQWSKRRVPAYWAYAYLLSTLYGHEEVNLTSWKDVAIVKAIYPEIEIYLTGKSAFLEFRSKNKLNVFLNGKRIKARNMGNDLWRIFPTKSGIVKFAWKTNQIKHTYSGGKSRRDFASNSCQMVEGMAEERAKSWYPAPTDRV